MEIGDQMGYDIKNKFERTKERFKKHLLEINSKISKLEGKKEKIVEEIFELNEERESLENEMTALNDTYNEFIKKTGI